MGSLHNRRKLELKHALQNAGSYDRQAVEDMTAELQWMEDWEKMEAKMAKTEPTKKAKKS